MQRTVRATVLVHLLASGLLLAARAAAQEQDPCAFDPKTGPALLKRDTTGRQSDECVERKSSGCQSCHAKQIADDEVPADLVLRDSPSMHASSVKLGCFDC